MALRVLLADESSTIKKVFQLALQDFAVEVQTVNLGVDVAQVAESFRPDIIFADVLLQKKSGYEVSSELKSDPALSKIPLVLMWSSFMEIDEDKMQASQADGRLEKPFDVKTLRKIIESFVPRTKEQKLSGYLSFPKLPTIEENDLTGRAYNPNDLVSDGPEPTPSSSPSELTGPVDTTQAAPIHDRKDEWNMESFEPLTHAADDQFEELNLKPSAVLPEPPASTPRDSDLDLLSETSEEDEKDWQEGDIDKYKIRESNLSSELTKDPLEDSDPSVDYFVDDQSVDTNVIMGPPPDDMEPEVEIELEGQSDDSSLPEDIENDEMLEAVEPTNATENVEDETKSYIPEGKRRGATVVLSLDEMDNSQFGAESLQKRTHSARSALEPSANRLEVQGQEFLSEELVERVIHEQAKEMIETAVWQILPDLATSIIERELKKLLDEHDNAAARP